eukprot:6208870-Pleurochrysis_carterae.AAC.2
MEKIACALWFLNAPLRLKRAASVISLGDHLPPHSILLATLVSGRTEISRPPAREALRRAVYRDIPG